MAICPNCNGNNTVWNSSSLTCNNCNETRCFMHKDIPCYHCKKKGKKNFTVNFAEAICLDCEWKGHPQDLGDEEDSDAENLIDKDV